jgi:ABC-type multidrug transport system ATPase subunit
LARAFCSWQCFPDLIVQGGRCGRRGRGRDWVLKVEKLKVHDLPPLSFEVAGGECLGVEGPSGSGKTLLLRALADLDPSGGYVFLEGAERREMRASQWRQQVRYIVAEPVWWASTPRSHLPEGAAIEPLVAALGLAPGLLDDPVDRLSTGERQRLALVRALADSPKVLLLDEPTSALDPGAARLVTLVIREQLDAGTIVLLVSHDDDVMSQLADARLQLGRRSPTSRGARP